MSVQVERIDLYRVRLPLRRAFTTSSHRKDHLEHILVRIESADGAVGWGECASQSGPYFGPETVDTCWLMIRDEFAPRLVGRPWDSPAQAAGLWRPVRGNEFARAALDMACWDLWSRLHGLPLATALGGERTSVAAGVSLGIEKSVPDLLGQVERFAALGYGRIKLKIAPGWEVAPVQAVRAAFPALTVQVDANGALPAGPPGRELLRALDSCGLAMIEQPFGSDDLLGHAEAQRELDTPICLDESITSVAAARTALALDACRIVNIKTSRLGGLTPARAVHDLCRQAGVPAWCGGMHEFGIGRAANLAVAALPGITHPSDLAASSRYYESDIVVPPIEAVRGRVAVPTAPGLGCEPDESAIRAATTARHTVTGTCI